MLFLLFLRLIERASTTIGVKNGKNSKNSKNSRGGRMNSVGSGAHSTFSGAKRGRSF